MNINIFAKIITFQSRTKHVVETAGATVKDLEDGYEENIWT